MHKLITIKFGSHLYGSRKRDELLELFSLAYEHKFDIKPELAQEWAEMQISLVEQSMLTYTWRD